MKKLLIALSLFISTVALSQKKDPIVMEVGPQKITKSEFLEIYLKNNDHPLFDKASMDKYVDIFSTFKMKVIEAENEGYDTLPRIKRELAGYRRTLAHPYLIDKTLQEDLVKQAYERLQKEVRASHILVKVPPQATPEDTLRAYKRILALRKRILNGEDFEKVARSTGGSDDPSVAYNGGDLGYFTAFQMVSPFEDAAYNTPVGQVSKVIRTRYGYHILKVTDVRPSRGTIKTAHIMIAVPKNATPKQIEEAKEKADEIYQRALKGEDFAELAKKYSDDSQSAQNGGELPAFGAGTTTRMIPEFEEAAFSLKNNGDIHAPIQTDYGFHIIKRLDWKPLASFDEMKKELENKVSRDERSKVTQDSFIAKLKKSYHFKSYTKKNLQFFYDNIDSSYFKNNIAFHITKDLPLFKMDKHKFMQSQFAKYIEDNSRYIRNGSFKDIVNAQYKRWEKKTILDYETAKLPEKYLDYKLLMNEYHDGVLLFDIMSDKVWNKASQDSVGMEKFYEANKAKYTWQKRINAYVYETTEKPVADHIYSMIQKDDTISSKTILEVINKDSQLNVKAMTNKYEIESTPFLKGHSFVKGLNPIYEVDGKYYVVEVKEIIAPMPKELSECRGQVISDYQDYLEKNWVAQLKQKYPVKTYPDVLYHLNDKK